MFNISIWGDLEPCFGGLSPPKPHRGDGTGYWRSKQPFKAITNRVTGIGIGSPCICCQRMFVRLTPHTNPASTIYIWTKYHVFTLPLTNWSLQRGVSTLSYAFTYVWTKEQKKKGTSCVSKRSKCAYAVHHKASMIFYTVTGTESWKLHHNSKCEPLFKLTGYRLEWLTM